MTDQEAIRILGDFTKLTDTFSKEKEIMNLKKALKLAIKALTEKAEKEEHVAEQINKLSCASCDKFGIDCGSCEVDEDD